jgi:hypothetical protein
MLRSPLCAATAALLALVIPAAASAHQSPGHRDFDGIISDDPLTLIAVAARNGHR